MADNSPKPNMENMSATFTVERIEIGPDRLSVHMHGIAVGVIAVGMVVSIPFNPTFSAGCEISKVLTQGAITILVVAAEEPDEAEFVASLNPVGETLTVETQTELSVRWHEP